MEAFVVALIMVSAAAHAIWNYVAKGSRDKDSFMLLINITSQFTLLPLFLIFLRDWSLPYTILPYLLISAIAELVYFLALSKAYDSGDLSIVYPIARSSPLIVAIIGAAFLGDQLTPIGFLGIALVFIGVYVIHLKRLELRKLSEPLSSLKGPAFRSAAIAALATTVYSLSDKVCVSSIDPLLYAFWLEISITILLTPTVISRRGMNSIRAEWSRSWSKVIIAGALMRGGYLLVLLVMGLAPLGYLLALRQVSVVVGALLGVLILREGYGTSRIIGSVLIFTGVYMLVALA